MKFDVTKQEDKENPDHIIAKFDTHFIGETKELLNALNLTKPTSNVVNLLNNMFPPSEIWRGHVVSAIVCEKNW